jgi:hypothetical protein
MRTSPVGVAPTTTLCRRGAGQSRPGRRVDRLRAGGANDRPRRDGGFWPAPPWPSWRSGPGGRRPESGRRGLGAVGTRPGFAGPPARVDDGPAAAASPGDRRGAPPAGPGSADRPWRSNARDVVGLSAVAAGVDPNQRRTACGNIHHHLVLGPETLARCLPVPLHPSIAHVRGRHRRENTRSSPKPAAVFANSRRASTLPSASTTTTASIRLCGPNTDHHLRHRCSFGHRIHSSEEGSATASVFSSP